MQFNHILSSVAARFSHDRQQNLIENCAAAWIANEAVVKRVRVELAVPSATGLKNLTRYALCIRPAHAHNGDAAITRRRRHCSDGIFLVHDTPELS
jgi:hypothetical protein